MNDTFAILENYTRKHASETARRAFEKFVHTYPPALARMTERRDRAYSAGLRLLERGNSRRSAAKAAQRLNQAARESLRIMRHPFFGTVPKWTPVMDDRCRHTIPIIVPPRQSNPHVITL